MSKWLNYINAENMRSSLQIRSVPVDVAQFGGSWGWRSTNGQQYIIKVAAAKNKPGRVERTWCIASGAGDCVALVNANNLCDWLDLNQLMMLNPVISLQAASIALVQNDLVGFLSNKAYEKFTIKNDRAEADAAELIHIELQLAHCENQISSKKKPLCLFLSIQILREHLHSKSIYKLAADDLAIIENTRRVGHGLYIEVGCVSLTMQQVQSLVCGSLLLIPGRYTKQKTLCLKTKSIEITIEESEKCDEWSVIEVRHLPMHSIEQSECISSANSNSESGSMSIDDIPVTIKIQLAQADIKMVDLKRIELGAVVTLETPDDLKVDIVCNDIMIAQGCLVELDGQLAVEIQNVRQSS